MRRRIENGDWKLCSVCRSKRNLFLNPNFLESFSLDCMLHLVENSGEADHLADRGFDETAEVEPIGCINGSLADTADFTEKLET
jgi:hypothetical protein